MLKSLPAAYPVYLLVLSIGIGYFRDVWLFSNSWLLSLFHLSLIYLSVQSAKSWFSEVVIEIDGFVVKRGGKLLAEKATGALLRQDSSGAMREVMEDLPTWPSDSTLSWTPFHSLSYNKPSSLAGHFWSRGIHRSFRVRSVGYGSSKQKSPSDFAMYECIGVDLVRSNKVISDIIKLTPFSPILDPSSEIPLPWRRHPACKWSPTLGIPRLVIFNAQLPYSSPSMWTPQSADSDPGFSCVSYAALSPTLIEAISSGQAPKSVGLLQKLLAAKESTKEGVALKVIGKVENFDELGLPEIVGSYNGKPALLTNSCKFTLHNEEVLEVQFDVRLWNFVSRKTFSALQTVRLSCSYFFISASKRGDRLCGLFSGGKN